MTTALDLIRARRLAAPVRPRRAIPRQLEPTGIQLDYLAALKPMLAAMREAVERRLVERLPGIVASAGMVRDADTGEEAHSARSDADSARHDADSDSDYGGSVAEALEQASDDVAKEVPRSKVTETAQAIARRISTFGRAELAKQFRAGLGIDVMMLEPWLPRKIAGFTAENVSLIKSIPDQFFAQVEREVISGIRAGQRHTRLAETVRERFSVSESRARLIARDQTNKFNGELNRARQEDLGVEHFIWRTAGDNRVREAHEALNGKRFSWAKGANGEFPGGPVQCRCTAEPDLAGLIERLEQR